MSNAAYEALFRLQCGSSPATFRSNVRKFYQTSYLIMRTYEGAMTGYAAAKERLGINR